MYSMGMIIRKVLYGQNCSVEVQYQSDAKYKSNAFIASEERIYRQQQIRLTLMTNAFNANGECVYP